MIKIGPTMVDELNIEKAPPREENLEPETEIKIDIETKEGQSEIAVDGSPRPRSGSRLRPS